MCSEIKCQKCQKSTWRGCGQHLESVFKTIPYDKRCWCRYDLKKIDLNKMIENAKAKGSCGPFP